MNVKVPPAWRSPEHSHPGSEAFYVLKGRVGHKSLHGTHYADAATVMNSHGGNTPMQVFNAGETDLELFAMFVLDATRPFSSPAKLD
jgi:quercetin dioxygenase-like cupin family protein